MGSNIRKIPNGFFQNLQLAGTSDEGPGSADCERPGRAMRPGLPHSLPPSSGERCHERGLDRVFHELDMPHAHPAREHGDQSAVIVPEEVLHQARRFRGLQSRGLQRWIRHHHSGALSGDFERALVAFGGGLS